MCLKCIILNKRSRKRNSKNGCSIFYYAGRNHSCLRMLIKILVTFTQYVLSCVMASSVVFAMPLYFRYCRNIYQYCRLYRSFLCRIHYCIVSKPLFMVDKFVVLQYKYNITLLRYRTAYKIYDVINLLFLRKSDLL